MAIIMEKGEGSYLTGVMFSPPSDFFEGTLDHVAQKAKGYAGPDGHLASMPELLHASTLAPSSSELWMEMRIVANSEEYIGKTEGGKPVVLVVHGGGLFLNDAKRLEEVKKRRWAAYSKQVHDHEHLELLAIGAENHEVAQWARAMMQSGDVKPDEFSFLDHFVFESSKGPLKIDRTETEYMRQQLCDGMGKPHENEFTDLLAGKLPDGKTFPVHPYSEMKRGVRSLPRHYGIVLDFEEAKKTPSGYTTIAKLAENQLFIARGGGVQDAVARYLDDVEGRLETDHYGIWHPFDIISPDKPHAYPLVLGRMNQDPRIALVVRQLFEGFVGMCFPDYGSVVAVQSRAQQGQSLIPPLENLMGGSPRYVPKELRMHYFDKIGRLKGK
ncbi:TPA: hypothetical protein HA295_05370 [Candidatus Woesearchaeota archaeon]|nr:hypothetical protein [Candidatus Woesearchaeota archaeon]